MFISDITALVCAALATITAIPPPMGEALIKETQVVFDDLPDQHIALNPSMVRFGGQTIMVYRRDFKPGRVPRETKLAIVVLDNHFQPAQVSQTLDTRISETAHYAAEDPRLFVYRDELYVLFNQTPDGSRTGLRKVYLGHIKITHQADKHTQFTLTGMSLLTVALPNSATKYEKNWVPLVADDVMRIAYNANPPQVYTISDEALEQLIARKPITLAPQLYWKDGDTDLWQFGEMRGGTPAIRGDDGRYYAFFHSYMCGVLRIELRRNYFMGFYAFESEPPYAITAITPEPLPPPSSTASQYNSLIIFPGGFFDDGQLIHVAYGIADQAVYVASIDKQHLYAAMQPVVHAVGPTCAAEDELKAAATTSADAKAISP